MRQLVELHKLLPEDRKDNTVILAISPDSLEKIREVIPKVQAKTDEEFAITLLSDADHKVIDRYGLLNEAAAKRNRFLPHPTTYVVDRGGVVRWKFTEKNYRIRPTNEMILRELQKLPSWGGPPGPRAGRQAGSYTPVATRVGAIPPGFTSIFNGANLDGWHISAISDHGNSKAWRVENGVLTGTQDKPGNGGILLTDKRYKNFEVYLEIKPGFGCDGGLFLRSNERGQAYQVMLDYREGGSVGGVYGEQLKGVETARSEGWEKAWQKGEWNAVRARMEGSAPHITVWLNGVQILDWKDTANHSVGGAEDGMIAVQVHGGTRAWASGGFHRFRNIAVKEF